MLKAKPSGFHTKLNPDLIDRIIEAVPEVIVQNQVAYRVGVPPQTFSDWLKFGARDIQKDDKESIFAQLSDRYHKARTEILNQHLDTLSRCPKNYGALTWILEKCFREDFGADSAEIKELRAMFAQLMLRNGDANHGEADSSEAKEDTQE